MIRIVSLIVLLSMACGAPSFAQHWNVVLGGGLATNTVPNQVPNSYGTISGIYGLSVSRNTERLDIGLSVSLLPLVSESETFYTNTGTFPADETTYRLYYAKKALVITPFLNYQFLTGANTLYAGVNAGISPTFAGKKENLGLYGNSGTKPVNLDFSYKNGLGFTTGLQAGYRRTLRGNLFIGGELGGHYFTGKFRNVLSVAQERQTLTLFYFTGMINLGLRL